MSYVNPAVLDYPADAIQSALEKYPTPFFIYDEKKIRSNCRRVAEVFRRYFERFDPLYAIKANTNPHILKIVFSEGWGSDCSSEAEAWITHELGVRGMYTGNYNTEAELRFVLDKDILLNLDDISQIPTVARIGMPEFISFRVNPGITRGSMKSLLFAGDDAKYGISVSEAVDAYREAKSAGARQFGIHMMTGSNVLDEEYFKIITLKLLEVAGTVRKELGIQFEHFNIGGGFGVPYRPEEKSLDLDKLARGVRSAFDEKCPAFDLEEPVLTIEPGRLLLADCGWLVGKVHVIKQGKRKFVGIDAGMNDLPRPAIYDAYHHVSILEKAGMADAGEVNIVGRLCENNDQFARSRRLPGIDVGDHVIIHNAGAHSYSMGHNYNNRPRSAEYLIGDAGEIRKIRRAETFEDLYRTANFG